MAPARPKLAVRNASVDSIRVAIERGNATERGKALQDLIYFFSKKLQGNSHGALDAKAFHNLLEALFRCVVSEKKTYLGNARTTKNAAEARLVASAEALRLAVNYGAANLKRKVARAIVDHITQTLPSRDGGYVEPLLQDYTKALVALLGHSANVEQLGKLEGEGWLACTDFFINAISHFADVPDREHILFDTPSSRASPAPSSAPFSASLGRAGSLPRQRSSLQAPSKILETLVQGLYCLVSVSNASLESTGPRLASAAILVLQMKQLGVGIMQQTAIASLRCIVQQRRGDDVSLVEGIVRDTLPLLGYWWHPKSSASQSESVNAVREEVLRFIFLLQLHIEALALHSPVSNILEHVQTFQESLWLEYTKRDDRTRLQVSDLAFSFMSSKCFNTGVFGLSSQDPSAERRWAMVEVMALLEAVLSRNAAQLDHDQQQGDSDGEQPRKRRRVGERQNRMVQHLDSTDPGMKLTALQILPFFLNRIEISLDDFYETLLRLSLAIGDKQSSLSSWALIASASCTIQRHAKDEKFAATWKQMWQIAARSVSIPGTSRAACLLLHAILEADLVPYHLIGDDVNSLVTATEVSGPALLVDSSLVLMMHLLHLRNTMLPSASQITSSSILRWAFSRWKPAEASFASLYSAHSSSYDLISLFMACIGAPESKRLPPLEPFGGVVMQTWKDHMGAEDMMRYLLLLPKTGAAPPTIHAACACQSESSNSSRFSKDLANANSAKKIILELFQPLIEAFGSMVESWSRNDGESVAQISLQRMQSLATFSIVVAILAPYLGAVDSSLSRGLNSSLLGLVDATFAALQQTEYSSKLLEVWLTAAAAHLPRISVSDSEKFAKDNPTLLKLFFRLSRAMEDENAKQFSPPNPDEMDLDGEFEAASSQRNLSSKAPTFPRQHISLSTSSVTFYLDVSQRLLLLSHLFEERDDAVGVLPEAFVDQLVTQSEENLLLCSRFMTELFGSDIVVVPEDALRVVEAIGLVLGQGEYSCCEVALAACIAIMESFVCVWPDEKLEVVAKLADLYCHFIDQRLTNSSLSPFAQICLAKLLYHLLEIHPSYGSDLNLPSCRSSLLSLLSMGCTPVRYYVGMNLPKIFGLYVLKVHDDLFIDILESLPSDPAWAEGIAFRLFCLAELACAWPTLLRRCIYHIFETPGRLKYCAKFASRSLTRVSKALALESPQKLFQLFAPQLLYTWLEKDTIEEIPYEIFGFASLDDLILQAQTEAAALMMMRGQETEAFAIAARLSLQPMELMQRSFAKVMAYCIAHDVSMPKETTQTTGESRLRKVLGRDQFVDAVYHSMADIVAILFDIIDQEDPIEKYFSKDPALKYAADIMAEIKGHCHSSVTLPANQQPMFRAKFLVRELVHICSRTAYDFNTLWSPALVASVARSLLNTIRPALGPLHACSVIRKVRVLVCLAGEQATNSYPLQMLLHSLRPFIQDAECADDALGITKYLLLHGAGHLAQFPSFYAGYSLSLLASLRMFLESSQSSTTQESQFKATMGNAQSFHVWLTKQLQEYDSLAFKSEEQRAAFRSITRSATNIRASGNAEKGTPESTLLLEILKDGEQDDRLLDDSARDLVLGMLCSDFHVPTLGRSDIIETDQDAIEHGPVVWKSCGANSLSKEYLVWAGRVMGRSFAASGTVPKELVLESRLSHQQRPVSTGNSSSRSEHEVLRLLETLTTSPDSITAGLAESALRTIVSQATALEDSTLLLACQSSLTEPLFASSAWTAYRIPPSDFDDRAVHSLSAAKVFDPVRIGQQSWAGDLAVYLAQCVTDDVVLSVLPPILKNAAGFADKAFPFIVHLVLQFQLDKQQAVRKQLAEAARAWLASSAPSARENVKLLINTLVYIRMQPFPNEASIADRRKWLDIDLLAVAAAASRCGLFKVALLFSELALSESSSGKSSSRRSSFTNGGGVKDVDLAEHSDLLLDIYENIDDPDAYYGLPQSPSLASVLARLEHEKDGTKTLAFRGAQYDSHLRRHDPSAVKDGQALVQTLSNLGLSGLSHSLLQTQESVDGTPTSIDSTFTTARRLGIWNLPVPPVDSSHAVTVYRAFQSVHQATDLAAVQQALYEGLGGTMEYLTSHNLTVSNLHKHLGALAALTELDEVLNATDASELQRMLELFEDRSKWMMSKQYDDVSQILSYRETTLSAISQQSNLRDSMRITPAEARLIEIKGLLLSSSIYRFHHVMQESLNMATSLVDLIEPSEGMGLHVDAAIKMETANSLWDHGEMLASIRMLQGIERDSSLKKQTVPVSRADLLSKIGYQVSVARLESADSIQKKYLEPALTELKGRNEGQEAGRVFHQFAMFCDQQLQNPDNLEDLSRLQSLKQGKSNEVQQLQGLVSNAKDSQMRARYNSHLNKARQWLELDAQELSRVEKTRTEFVRLSLENYLLSLTASDEHNNDALRFAAMWLERSSEDSTNEAVKKYLEKVPTRKFAPLMNQLTSRLQDHRSLFQRLLIGLVFRICCDHPYHGMYQIWSGARTRPNAKDNVAVLRQRATERVAKELSRTEAVAPIWTAIDKTSKAYHMLAVEKDGRYKAGHRVALKESQAGSALVQSLGRYAIPPPTVEIALRADKAYVGQVPMMVRLEPTMTVALGASAPKIMTAVGSDGVRYKQLVKGGNDDLRQDAIMEQVFSAVSALLKRHRGSRQRDLGIRTYKVLPLTASSGLIEFVPNTVPLHEYLMPAHSRYYPKDLKGSQCRKEISGVENRSVEQRISTYRKVAERFHPVMRYFFLEYFPDPDEWFGRRLAYTRATAAISMLGHVLGLGDRHGHNILLDSKTGEVVHIDLGVAFEMGRVLPVPELVPFRLTRDIVDGMGITGTEGVFRRCCEFTLDAMREETYSIMTILDVLRYDPLYSWSISPVRLAKLQDARSRTDEAVAAAAAGATASSAATPATVTTRGLTSTDDGSETNKAKNKPVVNEPSEADRALEVVRKKLSKTLSVTATVNDLINQATDERNLAVLYSGESILVSKRAQLI